MNHELDIRHVVCPMCNGSGAELHIDLSSPTDKARTIVDGKYAEVCSKCKGVGWIHEVKPAPTNANTG